MSGFRDQQVQERESGRHSEHGSSQGWGGQAALAAGWRRPSTSQAGDGEQTERPSPRQGTEEKCPTSSSLWGENRLDSAAE